MPDINSWMTDKEAGGVWESSIEGDNRSVHFTHRIIMDKPAVIVIQRKNGQELAPQTVRIEMTRIKPDINVGPGARESRSNTILIGYKGHPTIPDTDMQVGDRFAYGVKMFTVRQIFTETVGRVEAWLEDIS
jgi:hypothetical protein